MNIRVEKRENPYLQVDKTAINDIDLSPQSLGVLVYILSKPNNWKAHKNEIVKRFGSSKHIKSTVNAVDNCFIELRKAGYIKIVPTRNAMGQVSGSEYVFFEVPSKPTEMATSTEMARCSEVGESSTVLNLSSYNKESSSLMKNNKKKKENENAPAKFFKTLSENDSTTTPTPSLDAPTKQATVSDAVVCPSKDGINPNLRKIYETPAQMSSDLFTLWKSSEGHAEALKAVVEPLGIKTTEKKILFGRYLRDSICSKILTSPTYGGSMQSVIELHKLIVFKYLTFKEIKAEILELKEEPKKDADEYDRTRATARKDKYADM